MPGIERGGEKLARLSPGVGCDSTAQGEGVTRRGASRRLLNLEHVGLSEGAKDKKRSICMPGMPFDLFFTLSERRQPPSLLISTFSRTFCCCVLLSLCSLPCPSVISIALTFLRLLSYSLSYFPSLATLFLPLFSCSSPCPLFITLLFLPFPSLFLPFHSRSFHFIPVPSISLPFLPLYSCSFHFTPVPSTLFLFLPFHSCSFHFTPLPCSICTSGAETL